MKRSKIEIATISFCWICGKPAEKMSPLIRGLQLPICGNSDCEEAANKKTRRMKTQDEDGEEIPPEKDPEEAKSKEILILVVEDEYFKEIATHVMNQGFRCVIAQTQEEADKLLEENAGIDGAIISS